MEFFSGNKEYDYKIDAASGAILGFDFDVEWYTVSSKASDYIGEAKAKQIVEQAAGTTGVYTEFKLEVDDGRVLYEGEMRSGWMEYEFEIDAVTGAILDGRRLGLTVGFSPQLYQRIMKEGGCETALLFRSSAFVSRSMMALYACNTVKERRLMIFC